MLIDFDPAKDKLNRAQHGLSLAFAKKLIWEEALVWVDSRYEYDEIRMIGLVPEGSALYYLKAQAARRRPSRILPPFRWHQAWVDRVAAQRSLRPG